ncbi:MAG: hypothetical protein Ct9H300mP22_3960 [Gammaproteobacteria bacterium]|nr:MAG: hypothetical protein Ct9H300mP22_3960 [Gammaproteobacteria bacterium]
MNEYNGDSLIKTHLRDIGEITKSDYEFGSSIIDAKTFQSLFEDATTKWIRNELNPSENESNFEYWQEFKQRVYGALDEIMSQHSSGSRVLISTSGGVIAMALQRVLQFPDDQVIQTNWVVHNSSVTRIRYGNGKISLRNLTACLIWSKKDAAICDLSLEKKQGIIVSAEELVDKAGSIRGGEGVRP